MRGCCKWITEAEPFSRRMCYFRSAFGIATDSHSCHEDRSETTPATLPSNGLLPEACR